VQNEWFKAAKAHMDLPSLGRSVHHVKGQDVQRTLTLQVHHKSPSEPKNWQFEVLTKMVIVKQQQIASEEWLTYARAFLAPSLQQSPPQESKRDLSQETKGEARRKNPKNKEPTNENNGTD
jgi:hypothetical protein